MAVMPRISAMLAMLDPRMLPRAMPVFPERADETLTVSSGMEVPKAITVRPTTVVEMPMRSASVEPPVISQFAPWVSSRKPAIN